MSKEQKTPGIGRCRFRPYPEYKDSGVEWLGKIPSNWVLIPLKHLTVASPGSVKTGPFGSQLLASDMTQGEIKVYNQRNIIANDFAAGENYISMRKFRELAAFEVFKNDILVTTRGTIGKCAIVPKGAERGILHPCILRIQPDTDKIKINYLSLIIQESNLIIKQLALASNATTIDVIYSDTMRGVLLPCPPINEQSLVFEFLDRETTKIDALIEKKERLIELLQEKRTALITQAVTKGLDPNVPMKDSGVEWLGKIPVHWDLLRLKYLSSINDEVLNEKTDPCFELIYVDIGGVDQYQGIVTSEELVFETAPSRARRIARVGDVIISTVRTYLRAIAPIKRPESNLIVSTGFAVIRPLSALDCNFAPYALRASNFVESIVANSVGVSYPAIDTSKMSCFTIATPDIEEQQEIVAFLDRETAKIDALVAKVREAISRLKEYRTALISAAVTGKIDVRES